MADLEAQVWRQEFTFPRDGTIRATDYVTWLIDGVPLRDFVADSTGLRKIEEYRDPVAAEVLPPSMHMWGSPEPMWTHFTGEPLEGIVGLLVCSCGIQGCSAVIADLDATSSEVSWRRIRLATVADHPGGLWPDEPPPDLTFDSEQYALATESAATGPLAYGSVI